MTAPGPFFWSVGASAAASASAKTFSSDAACSFGTTSLSVSFALRTSGVMVAFDQ